MKCQGDEWKDLLAVAKRSNIGRGGILLQILRCSNRDLLLSRFLPVYASTARFVLSLCATIIDHLHFVQIYLSATILVSRICRSHAHYHRISSWDLRIAFISTYRADYCFLKLVVLQEESHMLMNDTAF
jgi:hypothetical protein